MGAGAWAQVALAIGPQLIELIGDMLTGRTKRRKAKSAANRLINKTFPNAKPVARNFLKAAAELDLEYGAGGECFRQLCDTLEAYDANDVILGERNANQ